MVNAANTVPVRPLLRRLLHWLSALLVLALLVLGVWMTRAELDSTQAIADNVQRFSLHKTLGVLVLVLTLLRFAAIAFGRRQHLSGHAAHERLLASLVQGYFLLALLALPIVGLLIHAHASGAAPLWLLPASWFDSFANDADRVARYSGAHQWLSWGLMIALMMHVAGALKHHLIDRDQTLSSMGFGRSARTSALVVAIGASDNYRRIGALLGALLVPVVVLAGYYFNERERREAAQLDATGADDSALVSLAEQSTLAIDAVQGGEEFRANFERFDVRITLASDGKTPDKINVAIDSGSFVSGLSDRDDTVYSADWLNVDAFPVAHYRTTMIEADGDTDNAYRADGVLEIKGNEAPVAIQFTFKIDDPDNGTGAKLIGGSEFDRFAIKLGERDGEDAAGREVVVRFDIRLHEPAGE